jgi:integrase
VPQIEPRLATAGTYLGKLAPLGASLSEAVDYFVAGHQCPPATVDQLVAELLTLKTNDTGTHNAKDLRLRLENRFCLTFGKRQIGSIRSDELSRWITAIPRKLRTRRNFYAAIITLFEYARENGYLAKGRPTEIHQVKRPKCGTSEIKVFSPDELKALIGAALLLGSRALAAMLIQCMAGLRHEELEQTNHKKDRLRWRDVRLDQAAPEIHVRDIVSKTGKERFVPIHPALVAWLRLLLQADNSPIYDRMSLSKDYARICKAAGLSWKKNGPRKSYNTYHTALSGSLSVTADAAGNSPGMITTFYRKELSQVGLLALAWFSLSPEKFELDLALYLLEKRN